MRRSIKTWATALLAVVLLALLGVPAFADPGSAKPSASKATAKTAKPKGKAEVAKYPRAHTGKIEVLERTFKVGHEYTFYFPTAKAQRVHLFWPGLPIDNVSDPEKRYKKWGWTSEALFVAQDEVVPHLESIVFSPAVSYKATKPEVIVGRITVFDSFDDKKGEVQEFRLVFEEAATQQVKAEPTPRPEPTPTPAPPIHVQPPSAPPPPAPAPTAKPTPKPPTKPSWYLGGEYNQDFFPKPGVGGEFTSYTFALENRLHAKDSGFASWGARFGGTPDGFHDLLPAKPNDGILQLAGHLGLQSGEDYASIGAGFNIEANVGKPGGIPEQPFSVIGRLNKVEHWLDMTFGGSVEVNFNIPDEVGYQAELKWLPPSSSIGVTAGIDGKQKADVGHGTMPKAGVVWEPDKNTTVKGTVGWNANAANFPVPGLAIQSRW